MSNKSKHLILGLVLCAITFAVCLLPWPTRISMVLNGVVVTADGEADYKADFTVKGWKLNYLFRKDSTKVTVDFPDNLRNAAVQDAEFKQQYTLDSLLCFSGFAMDAAGNRLVPCSLVIDLSEKQCLVDLGIFAEGVYLVGAVAENADPKEILNTFSRIVK